MGQKPEEDAERWAAISKPNGFRQKTGRSEQTIAALNQNEGKSTGGWPNKLQQGWPNLVDPTVTCFGPCFEESSDERVQSTK